MNNKGIGHHLKSSSRIEIIYGIILLIVIIFGIRLFYLQVIKSDYYTKQALLGQLREYQIPAKRGVIEVHDKDNQVPIVLNEKKYTLFADPKFIKNPDQVAIKIQALIGGNSQEISEKLQANTRYSILAKKLSAKQKSKLDDLEIKGIGTREESVRTYPQGNLAAQLLGFVDDEGNGKYGLEQYLNTRLSGEPGQLKAITDVQGVPLVSNKDNVIRQPVDGDRVLLTIDLSMQKQLEDILKKGLDRAISKSGSAIIMDPSTGEIKAMANYPSYNPAEFFKVENGEVFNNAAVSAPLEVGSIMKPLTAAAAINQGVVSAGTTYYDPSFYKIGDATVTNIEEDGGAGTRSVRDILELSLNTGATWLLMQMGGGSINQRGREIWHDYMVDHFRFSKTTGVEQGYEAGGSVPDPNDGFGLNIVYANTSFGQGMTATPLQMGAALSSIINGGKYYQPHLIDTITNNKGEVDDKQPKVVKGDVISPAVSKDMISLMEGVVNRNYLVYGMNQLRDDYSIGGKTGTAQIAKPGGGYYEDKYNGTFMGFVGGDKPEYVIVTRVNDPGIGGYAGSRAAAPVFSDTVEMLINSFNVKPKTK